MRRLGRWGWWLALMLLPGMLVEARGAEGRPKFTTSRLKTPPEPPSPYMATPVWPKLKWTSPLDLTTAPGEKRLFVVEQGGKIYSFDPTSSTQATADLAVDLKPKDPRFNAVYALTFHPRFAENRYCYICYVLGTEIPNGTRVSRFTVSRTDPPRIDFDSEVLLLEWISGGHNGCCLKFGPDGYLYVSTGDGSGPSPPDGLDTGQNLTDLLSCILRIDVDQPGKTTPYRIPNDNPFVKHPGARGEIWAYGFRNPWRMNFDKKTGALWVGDVGWELWELLYRVEKGGNYGWSIVEGSQSVRSAAQRGPTPILPPVVQLPHSDSASITGGISYYGNRFPELHGYHLYGDWETGKIWGVTTDGKEARGQRELVDTPLHIVSFCEGHDGELLILDYTGGGIFTLERNPRKDEPHFFPKKLSETGLFTSVAEETPATGVVPYQLVAEPWQDGVQSRRWVALPGETAVRLHKNPSGSFKSPIEYPEQSLFVKTLSVPSGKQGTPNRRVETQILHIYEGFSRGYSYRWNADQTDAELVEGHGREELVPWPTGVGTSGEKEQTYRWRFHSRAECVRCHNQWCSFVIGFIPEQLQGVAVDGSGETQLARFQRWGMIAADVKPTEPNQWANPYLSTANLEHRARSYLHVNCAHCHRMSAGGSTNIELNKEMKLAQMKLVGVKPLQGSLGLHQAQIVTPGDPYRSVLFYRLAKIGTGHMPHIGSHEVDEQGLKMIHDWIRQLPAVPVQGVATQDSGAAIRQGEDQDAAKLLEKPANSSEILTRLMKSSRAALRVSFDLAENRYPTAVRQQIVTAGVNQGDPSIRDLFERFLPNEQRTFRLGTQIIPETLLAVRGESRRGEALFRTATHVACRQCHVVDREGKDLGPNLSHIGRKYTKDKILEQILDPSRSIEPQYLTHVVETRSGKVISGLLVKKSEKEVVLKTAQGEQVSIPQPEIEELSIQRNSLMPQDLFRDLTAQEAADLLEFLSGLL